MYATRDMNTEDAPTTRLALFCPSLLEADCPSGMVAAAILVILIEEVLLARIVDGGSSADRFRKMASFSGRDSDTALYQREWVSYTEKEG